MKEDGEGESEMPKRREIGSGNRRGEDTLSGLLAHGCVTWKREEIRHATYSSRSSTPDEVARIDLQNLDLDLQRSRADLRTPV